MALEAITYLWKDRKRILGLPITFTRYRLSEDRIFRETGLLNLKEEEVLRAVCGVGAEAVPVSADSRRRAPFASTPRTRPPRTWTC